MQTVPSMSNANAITQGEIRSDYYSPSIHDLGASASNSTLILFDGHRVPEGDTQHSETDPNIIPIAALQRVEVLATGASSIYGSDAVAGVINFITRPSYEGLELSAQAKVADGYTAYTCRQCPVRQGLGRRRRLMSPHGHIWESAVSNAVHSSDRRRSHRRCVGSGPVRSQCDQLQQFQLRLADLASGSSQLTGAELLQPQQFGSICCPGKRALQSVAL